MWEKYYNFSDKACKWLGRISILMYYFTSRFCGNVQADILKSHKKAFSKRSVHFCFIKANSLKLSVFHTFTELISRLLSQNRFTKSLLTYSSPNGAIPDA